jgi:hypothetical protein
MNNISISIFAGFLFFLTNDMASKFIAGFITGIFISTKYDFKPYVRLIEEKMIGLHKELEVKREEVKREEIKREEIKKDHSTSVDKTLKPQMVNWNFNWLWLNQDSKKNKEGS